MINPNAKLTAEQFLFFQRFFYFMWEALAGYAVIVIMTIISFAFGTFMLEQFGDVGGFIWIGVTYAAFLGFDPLYNRMAKSMRVSLPKGVIG